MHSGHGECRLCASSSLLSARPWMNLSPWMVCESSCCVFIHIVSAAVTPMPSVKSKMCDNFCCKVRLSLTKTSAHRLLCEEMWVTYIRIHMMWNPYISYDRHTSHTEPVIPYMSIVILNSCRDIFELQFPGKATLQVLSCSHMWPRLKVSDICHPVPHPVFLKSTIAEMRSDSRSAYSRKSVSVQSVARSNLVLFVWRIKYRTKGNFLIECSF